MRTPVLVVLVCAVLVAGCGEKSEPQATPTFATSLAPSDSASPSTAPSPSATATSGGNQGPAYPTNAKAYAQAFLAAWGAKDNARINQLANQAALLQLNGYSGLNNQWNTFVSCVADGGTYTVCVFRNAHGDEIKLRLSNPLLGKPAAVTEALVDKTTYPAAAGDYASSFVQAWQAGNTDRMKRYANSSVISFFNGKKPSGGYTINVSEWDSTHWKVSLSGLPVGDASYTMKVQKSALGKASAIVGASN
jgi:hypothetical protein